TTVFAIGALTVITWPKLAHESLNGDGSEAYEIARSLESHPLPRWDMQRWEGPGRFGTPAGNPFLTNAYLAWSGMAILGRGELAARLPLIPALVIVTVVAGGLVSRTGRSGWAYLVAVSSVYLLWNAYYVGYEPTFTDLAEPAATDTLMIALWLAGFAEIVAGATWIGVGSRLLGAFGLFSAPARAGAGCPRRRARCCRPPSSISRSRSSAATRTFITSRRSRSCSRRRLFKPRARGRGPRPPR